MFILLSSIVLAEDAFLLDADEISGKDLGFLTSSADRISMLVPALFIIITLIAFFIDFGTIGVVIGSSLSLLACVGLGVIMLNGYVIIAFLVMSILLMFKMGGD